MKAFLMHPDQDFDTARELPANEPVLSQDLELNTLVSAMAAGDAFLFEIARRALLSSLRDSSAIAYRQAILKDALETPSVIRDLYAIAGEALAAEKSIWGSLLQDSPRTILGTSVRKMELLVAALRRLREIADQHAEKLRSPGLRRFFAMLTEELDDEYFELVEGYLKELKFKGGPLLSARLSNGNKGIGYTLRRPREQGFIDRLLDHTGYSFTPRPRRSRRPRPRPAGRSRRQPCRQCAQAVARSRPQLLHHAARRDRLLRRLSEPQRSPREQGRAAHFSHNRPARSDSTLR